MTLAADGADFLQLNPAAAPVRGLTGWLADAIRAAIIDGRLQAGAPLPATRLLAGDLGVSRGVIVEAYQRLADEGLVSARPGAGTRVLGISRRGSAGAPARAGGRPATRRSGLISRYCRSAGGRGRRSTCPPACLTCPGFRAPPGCGPKSWCSSRPAWPTSATAIPAAASGCGLSSRAGSHGPAGCAPIRTTSSSSPGWPRPWPCWPGCCGPGLGEIAVEDPGSRGSRDELAYWGLRSVPVPVDEHGLQVDDLARSGLRAVLLTPAHQFPTGVVLAPRRRRDLMDWAAGADALIIEDDYDAEYRYDRAPVPALQASAPGLVAYAGSTSKTLAPGMRLGWLIPPGRLHADLVEAKHASDLGSPALPQLVLARLIASGELEQHIRLVRKRQRSRRDALLRALHEHLPAARVQGIAAGLHLLITFPGRTGPDTDLAEAILRAGVLVHPLSWHRQRPGVPGIVLGYAAHTPDQLREAVRRIAQGPLAGRADRSRRPGPP